MHPTPYVVAANKQDHPDAWAADDLRIALRIEEGVKLLPCVAKGQRECQERTAGTALLNFGGNGPAAVMPLRGNT